MDNVSKALKLLHKADIIKVDDYLLHNWQIEEDGELAELESDEPVLEFSYTDDESQIFEFTFLKKDFTNKEIGIYDSQITLLDDTGAVVDIQCFKLSKLTLNGQDEQKQTVTA